MKVLLFGATGMVGQGVLRECLLAGDVTKVTSVGRTPLGIADAKLQEVIQPDLTKLGSVEGELRDHDACFFCLGVSSVGMDAATYERMTHDLTLSVATTLARLTPTMALTYVSGAGTDSTEQGTVRWARVKGRTENDLLKLPLARVFLFRPGVIQPMHAVRSKTALYRLAYAVAGPMLSSVKHFFPKSLVTSEEMGRAMLNAVRHEPESAVLEVADIVRLGAAKA